MNRTQFVSIEIGTGCNLGKEHTKCPNMDPARWANVDTSRALTDEKILDVVREMYSRHGFTGAIAWHYYNEPLLYRDRMLSLMERIKAEIPASRFALWTNGELIEANCDWIKAFEYVWITDYRGQGFRHVKRRVRKTKVMRWGLDGRKEPQGEESLGACGRMYSEFVIDHFGNVHICCIDWARNVDLGNVWDRSLAAIVEQWQKIRALVSGPEMDKEAPEFCRRCTCRHAHVASLIPSIAQGGRDKRDRRVARRRERTAPPSKLLAVAGIRREGTNDRAWLDYHERIADKVYLENDWMQAARRLKKSGAMFVAVMTTAQRLQGDVREALERHPNENILTVKGCGLDNEPRTGITIGKLSEIAKWAGPRPVLGSRFRKKAIALEELIVLSEALPSRRRVAVTFTHYRIPEQRLADHFQWNDELYRKHGARVFVVTDRQYDVPAYARCLVYPEEMPTFALSKTSNYGIRYAIDCGFSVIIKTDSDMVYPAESFAEMVATEEGEAVIPVYRMASNYTERETKYVAAPKATGTIAMVGADWKRARFHESCRGYGCDDGILRKDIARAGILERRSNVIYHIAHVPDTPQQEFNKVTPRVDHWNRDTGFNPENFAGNRTFHRKRDKVDAWGLPGISALAIVATHYRMPLARLDQWIEWNGKLFEEYGARAIIVSDVERSGLPDWLRVAVYPVELEMFSLSKTSNYGIRLAGGGIVAKTDPDCAFSREALDACLTVTETVGICPRYYMAHSYEAREQAAYTWDASKGTLVLHWDHWNAIGGYDERCEGYGIEDGDAYERARRVEGRDVRRLKIPFWHIAHSKEKQTRGNTRKDCWNRQAGFNPRNHKANVRSMRDDYWDRESWGIPSVE